MFKQIVRIWFAESHSCASLISSQSGQCTPEVNLFSDMISKDKGIHMDTHIQTEPEPG